MLTNTWNESVENPGCVAPGPDGLDLADWNTFRIYWYPALHRVEWTWVVDTANDVEVGLRTELDAFYLPDEPMALYFNFWAPPGPWLAPCDPYASTLQPVSDPAQDEICGYEIDYVEVRVLSPVAADYDQDGDVDLDDFAEFRACASGPAIPCPPGCESKDGGGDGDVDLHEFGLFQRCYSGQNNPADSDCE